MMLRSLSSSIMITRSALLVVLLAAMTATAGATLDLTSTLEEYVNGGITYRRLVFKDDKRRVEMECPTGWSVRTSSPARLELVPPGKGFAAAVIQTQPPAGLGVPDEAALKALGQQALAALPPDCQAATVDKVFSDPDGSGGSEVVLSYKSVGYSFRRSVRFLNLPECRLMVQISAPESEFEALSTTFRRTVQSLNWN
jgi:hypothetical protein